MTHDLTELKQFAELHGRSQGIAEYAEILARITSDEDGAEGSWAREWSAAAARHEEAGRLQKAFERYTMARFPYVDGPARDRALAGCVRSFAGWAERQRGFEPLTLDLPAGRVRAWAANLSAERPKPLLLIIGGIVSLKEQWAPVLTGIARLGMAGIVTELPGVGENAQTYTPDSWRMLPALLDAVADRADTQHTYMMAMSFGGHLALRAAMEDARIRGVVTAGAPVYEFYTDRKWQRDVPRLTMDTLAHLMGTAPGTVSGSIADWALPGDRLAALDIPVDYVLSLRDEITPPAEAEYLREHLRHARFLVHDDVHGAPGHVAQTRLWTAHALIRMRGGLPVQRALLGALLRVARARSAS